MICPPDHKHAATKTCYSTHKCKCDPCRENSNRDRAYRKRMAAYGRPVSTLVDAQPAREHIWDLRLMGMGPDRIAQLAGVNIGVIRHILWGTSSSGNAPAKQVFEVNARKILAVPLDPDLKAWLDPRGAHRRLQALAVQGWSFAKVADRLGITCEGVGELMGSYRILQSTHTRVVAVFNEMWDKTPPTVTRYDRMVYTRTRRWAARKGWVGPLAWDDIDHDEAPAEGVKRRVA